MRRQENGHNKTPGRAGHHGPGAGLQPQQRGEVYLDINTNNIYMQRGLTSMVVEIQKNKPTTIRAKSMKELKEAAIKAYKDLWAGKAVIYVGKNMLPQGVNLIKEIEQ